MIGTKIAWTEVPYLCPSLTHKVYDTQWNSRPVRLYVDVDHDETWNLVFTLGVVENTIFRLLAQQVFPNIQLSSVQPLLPEAIQWAESVLRSPMEWLSLVMGEELELETIEFRKVLTRKKKKEPVTSGLVTGSGWPRHLQEKEGGKPVGWTPTHPHDDWRQPTCAQHAFGFANCQIISPAV